MRKLFYLLSIILFVVIVNSCDDSLDPYGEMKERYVLNCVIRGDTTFQTATLTSSYQPEGLNPFNSETDNSVKGAVIRIWNGDKVTILGDTTIQRSETDLYKKPYTVFYSKSFIPEPSSTLEIEALLPNGKRLTSTAKVPAPVSMIDVLSDAVIPSSKNYMKFMWASVQKNPVFIPRLVIYYFRNDPDGEKRGLQIVPLDYSKYNSEWIPNYPKPTSEVTLTYNMSTINKAMELISEGDPNKSRYVILSAILEVLSLDPSLSMFYNASARDRDIYSVKLDETDFTNIKNGYGVFGVYMRTYWVSRFTHQYIRSFGYEPGLTEPK